MFSCEFCEISRNNFFTEHLRTTPSVRTNFEDYQRDCHLLVKGSFIRRRSSLLYNTSARHEWYESYTNDTVRCECNTNDTSATQVENLDFDNDTSENIFLHPYISYLAKLQMRDNKERNNFIPRTIFWKCLVPMPKCVWKVHHKNWTL